MYCFLCPILPNKEDLSKSNWIVAKKTKASHQQWLPSFQTFNNVATNEMELVKV